MQTVKRLKFLSEAAISVKKEIMKMEKKKYEAPAIEIEEIDSSDIVLISTRDEIGDSGKVEW